MEKIILLLALIFLDTFVSENVHLCPVTSLLNASLDGYMSYPHVFLDKDELWKRDSNEHTRRTSYQCQMIEHHLPRQRPMHFFIPVVASSFLNFIFINIILGRNQSIVVMDYWTYHFVQ